MTREPVSPISVLVEAHGSLTQQPDTLARILVHSHYPNAVVLNCRASDERACEHHLPLYEVTFWEASGPPEPTDDPPVVCPRCTTVVWDEAPPYNRPVFGFVCTTCGLNRQTTVDARHTFTGWNDGALDIIVQRLVVRHGAQYCDTGPNDGRFKLEFFPLYVTDVELKQLEELWTNVGVARLVEDG